MGGTFDVPFAHLAPDDAGVGSLPPRGQCGVEEFGDRALGGAGQRDAAADSGADVASGGVDGVGEGDRVRVEAVVVGRFVDQGTDRVVHAEVAPGLLVDPLWCAGAQDHAGSALVGLEFVEDRLDLPPLPIQGAEFIGGSLLGVDDRGDEAVASRLAFWASGVLESGLPFAADPSQQLAWADGDMIRQLIDGATYLFSNDYEAALIEQKTGWTTADVQAHVGTRVVTHGADGVKVYPADGPEINVRAIEGVIAVDPTGVGDSFRAGFLAAVAAGLGLERAAQVGCTIAASVVETKGTQEYDLRRASFLKRFTEAYGDNAAADVDAALTLR